MIYLLLGKDNRAIKQRVAEIEKSIFPSKIESNLNLLTFFLSENPIESIIEECQTYPAFASQKLIKVFEADYSDMLIKYIKDPASFSTLVLISNKSEKEISKKLLSADIDKIERFNESYKSKAIAFLQKELSSLSPSKDAINYIVEHEDKSLGNLKEVVEKIKVYYLDKSTKPYKNTENSKLSIDALKYIISSSYSVNIFDFIDSLFNKDIIKALDMLGQLMREKTSLIYIISMIYRQLKIIWLTKAYNKQGFTLQKIAQEVSLPLFVVKNAISQANSFSFARLEKLFDNLAMLDISVRKEGDYGAIIKSQIFIMQFKN